MKLNKLKNYISFNILALFGYVVLPVSIYYYTKIKPVEKAICKDIVEKYGETFNCYEKWFELIFYYLLVLFVIFLLILIDFLIRRKFKYSIIKFTENKIYSTLFWLGTVIVLYPFVKIFSFVLLLELSFYL